MNELVEMRQRVADSEAAEAEWVRAEEEIRQRTAQLEALREVGLELTAQLDLDSLLRSIVSRAVELLGATGGLVHLYDPANERLVVVMSYNLEKDYTGLTLEAGEGVAGKVFQTGEPLIIDDHRVWAGKSLQVADAGARSVLGIPLKWREQVIGVLDIMDNVRVGVFDEQDLQLLVPFAAQAAIAIRNARLYEQAQREIVERKRAEERVRRLLDQQVAVNRLALALGETRDLDEIYHIIYKHVRTLMDAEAFIVSLYDKETQLIRAGYVVAEGAVLDAATLPPIPLEEVGHGAQSQVIHTGEPLYIPDLRRVMERTRTEYTILKDGTVVEGPPSPENEEISRSALYVPMKIGGETIGVMQVQSYRLDAYSQDDIDLLSALANVAAVAIQNARLYEEARSRAERLAVVNRIARAVGATLHLDDLMETVYQEITPIFQADAFFIALYDKEANELDFRLQVDEGVREPPQRRPLGVGVTSLVVVKKKPLLIRNLEQERGHLPSPRVWGTMKLPASWLGVPMCIGDRLIGVISVQAYRSHAYDEEEQLLLSTIADQVAVAVEKARLYEAVQQELTERVRAEEELQRSLEKLRRTLDATVQALVSAIEMRDPYTAGHQQGVAKLACAIAKEMGLPEEQIEGIRIAGLIHDIGKINVPAEILSKPGPLNDLEFGLIRAHPQIGHDILKTIEFPWPVAQIVLQHHERMDGSGYPQGLSGEEIILEARILAVADVVEAMASHRPYRPPRGLDKALEEISRNRGSLYDPEVVDACLRLFTEKGFTFK